MKPSLIQIIGCSGMNVTSVQEVYRVKNHLFNLKKKFEEIEEIVKKGKYAEEKHIIDFYA
jgi:hypothetical protein